MPKRRTFGYYVIKAVRISGWFLLVLMLIYISSGYALRGEFGLDRLMTTRTAEILHLSPKLDRPLVIAFLIHVAGAGYLSMKRWGWIKRRKTS